MNEPDRPAGAPRISDPRPNPHQPKRSINAGAIRRRWIRDKGTAVRRVECLLLSNFLAIL